MSETFQPEENEDLGLEDPPSAQFNVTPPAHPAPPTTDELPTLAINGEAPKEESPSPQRPHPTNDSIQSKTSNNDDDSQAISDLARRVAAASESPSGSMSGGRINSDLARRIMNDSVDAVFGLQTVTTAAVASPLSQENVPRAHDDGDMDQRSLAKRKQSFKLMEAPSPRVRGLSRTRSADAVQSATSSAQGSPSRHTKMPTVQVRPSHIISAVHSMHERQNSGKEKPAKKPTMPFPNALPETLEMPLYRRCEFCVKFDSICNLCHKRWKQQVLPDLLKKSYQRFAREPETARIVMFLTSVARGTTEFVKCILDNYPTATEWCADFAPLDTDPEHAQPLADCGQVFPLHVACGYRRLDMILLLLDHGSYLRKSEKKQLPTSLLPDPIPEEWEASLLKRPRFAEHLRTEKARNYRQARDYAAAEAEYLAVLLDNPNNEVALCGRAKMRFDQDQFAECVEFCEKVLSMHDVGWAEFSPATVRNLLEHAWRRLHEVAHAERGPAKKRCGCYHTDRVVVSLRRFSFKFLVAHVLPFVDAYNAYQMWLALRRMPLWASTLVDYTIHTLPPHHMTDLLLSDGRARSVIEPFLKDDLPKPTRQFEAPFTYVQFEVIAAADFHCFNVKSFVRCINGPAWKKQRGFFSFGKKDDPPPLYLLSKRYQVSRRNVSDGWNICEAGEWEIEAEEKPVKHK